MIHKLSAIVPEAQRKSHFLRRLALKEKKKLDDSSRLCVVEIACVAWHASFQPLQQEKTTNSEHEQTPLSNDTIDSVLRHRELGRAMDLSTPPRKTCLNRARRCTFIVTNIFVLQQLIKRTDGPLSVFLYVSICFVRSVSALWDSWMFCSSSAPFRRFRKTAKSDY